jgi:hypothetical protein
MSYVCYLGFNYRVVPMALRLHEEDISPIILMRTVISLYTYSGCMVYLLKVSALSPYQGETVVRFYRLGV